jgi:cyclic beta-1,2-glucan synthetase
LHVEGKSLRLAPCVPRTWPGFEVVLRHGSATYEIRVENPDGRESGVRAATLDGKAVQGHPLTIPLIDDGVRHRLCVVLG